MINLFDLTYSEIEQLIIKMGEPRFRAKQIFVWLYGGAESFEEMSNLPKALREQLSEKCEIHLPKVEKKLVSGIDETRKYLLKLSDGNFIESVLMKYHHGYTICISSQVGCAMGCAFCASTLLGKVRSLTAGELVGQVLTVQKDLGVRISNIVLMGIGEPLDNFENVLKFLETVNHKDGLNIGLRHISLSTCGIVPRIYELADKNLQITLSVSLHATDNETRSRLMPVNRRYPISELIKACEYYVKKTNRRISFEYTLIAGENDSSHDARALAGLLQGVLCHVNLIPVNPIKERGFEASSRASAERFQKLLEDNGITATIRREMGSDISAACGQLRAEQNLNN